MVQENSDQIYYMVVDEKSTGPFTYEEVLNHPAFTEHTLVWKPGIDNWVAAGTLADFAGKFQNENPNVFKNPPQYGNPENVGRENSFPPQEEYSSPNSYQGPNELRNPNPYQGNRNYNPYSNHQGYQERQGYHHPHHQYNPYDPYRRNDYRPGFRTNWLPWAIVATVVGFFTSCIGAIFGIIGIVEANKANNMYARGFEPEGDAANANAKTMTIIGLILAGIGIICWMFISNYSWF